MSSLLSNDFVEEFFRFEEQLTTNPETFYIDREGKLIFTTPFKTRQTIIDDRPLILDANKTPDNVNLIIDSIVLFSTNPNIQNYLPLKFNFGSTENSKPKISFNDTTPYTLTDYKVIVSPRVNLDTVQNRRYTSPINHSFIANNNVNEILNVVRSGSKNSYRVYHLINQGGNVLYVTDSVTGITNTSILNNLTLIFGNTDQVVGIGNQSISEIYNLVNSVLIDTINEPFIDLFLNGNNLIVATQNGFLMRLHFYVKDVDGIYRKIIFTDTDELLVLGVGNYTTNQFFTYVTSGFISFLTVTEQNVVVSQSNLIEYELDLSETKEIVKMAIGGSVVEKPNISIFTFEDVSNTKTLIWYFFKEFNSIPSIKQFVLTAKPILKRYRNTVYLFDNYKVYLFNLDVGDLINYNVDRENSLVPRQSGQVNFTEFDFIRSGLSFTNPREIVWTRWENTRNLKDVYKLSYNYDERIFPYHKPDNFVFTVSLPNNNSVSDLEIFKYVIDYRIRYSKAEIIKASAIKTSDDQQELLEASGRKIDKQPRGGRKLGSASRILGLDLPEDFSVEDFLNIYSTR
jgi:hypothetical protein